jgi:hypothetical protein
MSMPAPLPKAMGTVGENTLLWSCTRLKMRQDSGKAVRRGDCDSGGGRPPALWPQRGGEDAAVCPTAVGVCQSPGRDVPLRVRDGVGESARGPGAGARHGGALGSVSELGSSIGEIQQHIEGLQKMSPLSKKCSPPLGVGNRPPKRDKTRGPRRRSCLASTGGPVSSRVRRARAVRALLSPGTSAVWASRGICQGVLGARCGGVATCRAGAMG